MFSVFRTLSLRYLSRRWFRALLIVASIALGVATLIATQALNTTMSQAALTAANPLAGIADLMVSNDELPLSGDLVDEIQSVPGVQSARPLITGKVSLPEVKDENGLEREVLVLGLDLEAETTKPKTFASDVRLLPNTQDVILEYILKRSFGKLPVVVGRYFAEDLGILQDGVIVKGKEAIKVRNRSRLKEGAPSSRTLVAVGAMDASGDSRSLSGPVLVMDLNAAATVLNLPFEEGPEGKSRPRVQRIDVVLEPGADLAEVRKRVEEKLNHRALVRTPQEQNESIEAVMRGMQVGFSLCGVAALIVGLFLVYNSLSVSVAERRHEIGVLLSLGATRLLVWRLFAQEAALLGLAGSLLGIPLGFALANIGLGPMQKVLQDVFYSIDARGIDVSLGLIALGVGVGTVTALAAALVPAYQASQETPAEAVRRVAKAPSLRRLVIQAGVSGLCMVVGLGVILLRDYVPRRLGMYGGLGLMFTGALIAAPFLAALVARTLQAPIRRFLGIEWRLAADNLVRAPGRTGLVIGALAAGVALVVQTAGVILSNQTAINDWVEESIGADLIVTSGGLVGAGGSFQPMDPSLGKRLEKEVAQVQAALGIRMLKVPFQGTRITVLAVEAERAQKLEETRLAASHARFYHLLLARPRSVIASNNFVAMHGYGEGDVITLPGPDGAVELTIVGTIDDFSWNHGSLIMNRADYLHYWRDKQVDIFDVYLTQQGTTEPPRSHRNEDASLERRRLEIKQKIAETLGAAFDLQILTRPELQGRIKRMIEQIYGVAYGQQLVVMLVAALGVVTSLLISVLQRRREMGLLRAIGASRFQVVRSVLCEACLMGLIGTGIGLLVGIPFQWYVLDVIVLHESGFLIPMYIPWKEALIISVGSMLTATLAGLGPAIYAVRQRIPEAIAYE